VLLHVGCQAVQQTLLLLHLLLQPADTNRSGSSSVFGSKSGKQLCCSRHF
jgi:hypothetical protein